MIKLFMNRKNWKMLLLCLTAPLVFTACGGGGGGGGESSTADTTGPTVSSTSPANSATAVAVNTAITATFSETMTASTITSATFTLNNGVTGAVTYSGTTATFTPSSNLAYSTAYTATITTSVKDAAGNAMTANNTWTFTTGTTADTTPPTVSSVSPANNAIAVAVNTAITATFSETMTASTVSTSTFTLNNGATGTVTYSGTTATFTPSSNLAYSTTYTATITAGAKDAAGNALASNYTWTFTTASASGTAPSAPTGLSATAGDGQVTVSWSSVSGATSYNIYWSTSSGVTKTNGTKISSAIVTSPYTQTGRTNGTMYYYVVTAVNSYGESSESSQVSAKPAASGTAPSANFKMPDTNQTTSYTNTFGEDHDYTINAPSYTDNGNGTITDNVTGLVWQKQDDSVAKTWANAVTYCDNLTLGSQTDWRLPSQIELISIIDNGVYNPSINTIFFPGTLSSSYWSSTTEVNYYILANAWLVNFNNGYSWDDGKTYTYYVRCVRGGQ